MEAIIQREYIYFLGFIISKAPWEYRTPVHFVKKVIQIHAVLLATLSATVNQER